MRRLFRQFSTPGGIPSHVSVTTPGSIHEGGELGYVLVHAFGAVMDNPDLLALAVVGDGEAETGPLEGSWKGISFLNPARDGAVLPILHLNGARSPARPCWAARTRPRSARLLEGHGYEVIEVDGRRPARHAPTASPRRWPRPGRTIREIQAAARGGDWDGTSATLAGDRAAHAQGLDRPGRRRRRPGRRAPAARTRCRCRGCGSNPEHLGCSRWLRSYRPGGAVRRRAARRPSWSGAANPDGDLRMSATPHANGGLLTATGPARTSATTPSTCERPARLRAESTRQLGEMMRDIYRRNPDRVPAVLPRRDQQQPAGRRLRGLRPRASWSASPTDDVSISRDGRVMEVLSRAQLPRLAGGLHADRPARVFATYEAFAMVSASQTIQHSKWLEEAAHLPWRAKVPSLNILLTSTCWRNDHNGFSHQGPG